MKRFIIALQKTHHVSAPLIITFQAIATAVAIKIHLPDYAVISIGIVGALSGLLLGKIYSVFADMGTERLLRMRRHD